MGSTKQSAPHIPQPEILDFQIECVGNKERKASHLFGSKAFVKHVSIQDYRFEAQRAFEPLLGKKEVATKASHAEKVFI